MTGIPGSSTQFVFSFIVFIVVFSLLTFSLSLYALITTLQNKNHECSCASTTVTVGVTDLLPCNTSAYVTNTGNSTNLVLDFMIPEGCPGQDGRNGSNTTLIFINDNMTNITYNTSDSTFYVNIVTPYCVNGTDGVDGIDGIDGIDGSNASININIVNGTDIVYTDTGFGINITVISPPGLIGVDGMDGTCVPCVNGSNGIDATVTVTILNSSNETIVYNTSNFNVCINISDNSTIITSANITVGDTITTPGGTLATVTNTGTLTDVILNFTIPAGLDGISPSITIGNTATTEPGTQATVTNVGTLSNLILDFTIPGATHRNYLFVTDNTTQTVSAADTLTNVTYNNHIFLVGWNHTPGSESFIATTNATYAIQSTILASAAGGISNFILVALLNGQQVKGSVMGVNVQSALSNQLVVSNFIVHVTVGDILVMQMACSRASGTIFSVNVAALANDPTSASIVAEQVNA